MAEPGVGIIKAMPVMLRPIDLQRQFAKRVPAVERLMATHRAQLTELDYLFLSCRTTHSKEKCDDDS